MSLYDYQKSKELIGLPGVTFYALIMAAMRQADTENEAKLRDAWPEQWAELAELYHTPAALDPKKAGDPPSFQECAEATLLFYSSSPWGPDKAAKWEQLTGEKEATTRALCDMIRRAQAVPQ